MADSDSGGIGAPIADVVSPRPVLRREERFEGKVFGVATEEVDLGGVTVTRDVQEHPGSVAVVPYREPGEVLMIRQYRHAVRAELWEPPAGLLDLDDEAPLDAAKRELREETDHEAATWHVLADVYSSPGASSEAVRMYLARDLAPVPEHERHEREAEERDMELLWVPVETIVEAVSAGRLSSPTAVIGVLAVEAARTRGWSTLRPADAPWVWWASRTRRPPSPSA